MSLINRVATILYDTLYGRTPALAMIINPSSNAPANISLHDLLDGILWATPKRRTPARKKWQQKYGAETWKFGLKLIQPKRNIINCAECGSFHEMHTICKECFKRINEESQKIIKSITNVWGRNVIDKDVEIVYSGEQAKSIESKRIVEQERPRPMWFVPNLSQPTAKLRKEITGPAVEAVDRTVKVIESNKDTT